MSNKEKLFALMQEHPELPIVPVVNDEVVGDGYGEYLGSLGVSMVDEYIFNRDNKVIFRSDGDVYDALEMYLPARQFEALLDDEDAQDAAYCELPWKKAILVCVMPLKEGEDE